MKNRDLIRLLFIMPIFLVISICSMLFGLWDTLFFVIIVLGIIIIFNLIIYLKKLVNYLRIYFNYITLKYYEKKRYKMYFSRDKDELDKLIIYMDKFGLLLIEYCKRTIEDKKVPKFLYNKVRNIIIDVKKIIFS